MHRGCSTSHTNIFIAIDSKRTSYNFIGPKKLDTRVFIGQKAVHKDQVYQEKELTMAQPNTHVKIQ
jgi:hypothetical protein